MCKTVNELRAWRQAEGHRLGLGRALTFEEAHARIVADGTRPQRSTWHAWESGRKIPSREHMPKLCQLLGVSSDIFYRHGPIERANTPPISLVA